MTDAPLSLTGYHGAGAMEGVAARSLANTPRTKGEPVAVGHPHSVDETRERIAYLLLGTLFAVIALQTIASLAFAADCWRFGGNPRLGACEIAKSSLALVSGTMNTIFTAMIGLVGSVVGFYFGSQKKGDG